jgi:uncharacterized protein YpbB
MTTNFDHTNEMFGLAVDLVNQSNRNIFLTGKAGTGKTTFLRYIREHSVKQTAVVAPTGVAAINAGGVTIHSFFQLPFTPFIPEAKGFMNKDAANNTHSLLSNMKLNRDRIKLLQQLELLIIDEISMVRADTLDAIDIVLRHYRHRHNLPFGGVQVLLIGDMYQLPPVSKDEEWNMLSQFYESPYFFSAKVMQQSPPVYIAFEKIYRQRDDQFIHLLNQVRNNELDENAFQTLNSIYKPKYQHSTNDSTIILTTHNYKADATNAAALAGLKGKMYSFKAVISNEFSERAYPAEAVLQLKVGAQVMFIKNDKEKSKRYYNGKIGTVTKIDDESIFVECKGETEAIEVTKETWENIRYSLNRTSQKVEEEIVGSFVQFPLRLAWAITIHKSQGLTFEKAVIDAGSAFAPGQVYVALSRCTSLAGITLQTKLSSNSLHSDDRIVQFSSLQTTPDHLKQELELSKKAYQHEVLVNLFNMGDALRECRELKQMVETHLAAFNQPSLPWLTNMNDQLLQLQNVATKFKAHLDHFFSGPDLLENNGFQQRIIDATAYFINQLDTLLQYITTTPAVTDNKAEAKAYNDGLKELHTILSLKKYLLQGCSNGFSIENFYAQKKNFTVPPFYINAYSTAAAAKTDSPHPILHRQLRELRNKICEQKNVPVFMIAGSKTIDEMAMYLPQTLPQLLKISGFGQAKAHQYGKQFLEVILKYTAENNAEPVAQDAPEKKTRKPKSTVPKIDTKQTTYDLFKQGKDVATIAAERNMAATTIESHLAFYVERGLISVNELVQSEKLVLIEPLLTDETETIAPIKTQLGNAVSFGEIRLALAARNWKKNKN